MKSKIEKLINNDNKISFSEISKELNISFLEVLRNISSPHVRTYPIEKIDKLFEILNKWEEVLLLVITPNFVLEIKDKFPQGKYGHGFLNFHDKETSIGGHLSVNNIKEIFIVTDTIFNKKSCSIKFFDSDEKEIFSIYVPRDEKGQLREKYLEIFNSL